MTDAELRQLEREATLNPILRRKLVREQRRRDSSWKDRRREELLAKIGGLERVWLNFFPPTSGTIQFVRRIERRVSVPRWAGYLPKETVYRFTVLGREATAVYHGGWTWICKWADETE